MITNKDRHPDVDWLPVDEIRQVGTIGGIPLVLLGFDDGFEPDKPIPVVARSYSADPQTEDLFAVPLSELMNSQDPIEITEDL